jgi:transcriptional regulator with XRE-family HTH domain
VLGCIISFQTGKVEMTSSVFTKKYECFRELLIQYRKDAGITQQDLAVALNKPQSYVSKYENGERRLDLVEFLDIAEALKFDKHHFIEKLEERTLNDK